MNLEKLHEIRQLDSDAQELLDWFMKALADPLLQRFVLSEQSRHKLAELTGNSRKWMTWLHDEVTTGDAKAKELMENEINRVAPTGVLANKPKWRLKIKLHTLSHSIRVPENFEQAVAATLDNLWNQPEMLAEFKSLVEAADSLEKQQSPSRPITLDEAMKLKAFCDAYLGNRARREVQKAIRQRQSAGESPTHAGTKENGY